MKINKQIVKDAFKASIPILLGYTAMGMASGILLVSKTNCGAVWGFFTAFTSISGALQFLLVDMFANQTPLITVAIITLSINLRYSLYGLPLIQRWKPIPLFRKMYMILTLTDEAFALSVEKKYPDDEQATNSYSFFVGAFAHFYWFTGVTSGCLIGNLLPFDATGIDFAMTALFIVILLDQLQNKGNHLPCLIGFLAGVAGLAIYPANMLIPAIVIIILALILFKKRIQSAMI